MPMIQGIDGMALIKAFRTGREDRAEQDKAQAEQARAEKIGGVMGQLFGGQTGGGVAGQYAPSQPAIAPTMADAFNPEVMGQIGAMDAGGAAPGAMAAPQAPMQRTGQQNVRPNPMQLARLIALDPKVGGEIASAFKSMNEDQIKMASAKNDIMGSAAAYVAQGKTPQERMERFQMAAPQLQAMGWTPEELDGIDNDLSDNALQGYQALAIAYDNRIDNELKEREFMMGKTVAIPDGGNLATVKPVIGDDGSVSTKTEYAIGGPDGEVENIPRPMSKAEADALAPGTRFIAPDGSIKTKPGGPTQPASGNFPAGQ